MSVTFSNSLGKIKNHQELKIHFSYFIINIHLRACDPVYTLYIMLKVNEKSMNSAGRAVANIQSATEKLKTTTCSPPAGPDTF